MNNFQERLQDLLIENNLSRLQLANAIGISSTTINGYFNKNYFPQIEIAIKIAKYFNCSLDYLFGLSDNIEIVNNNECDFITNFNNVIKTNNLSIAKAMKELNMSEFNYYRWRDGMFPKTNNLLEIAQHFDVSLDYLVGRVNTL